MSLTTISLEAPYALFLADCDNLPYAKTASGIAEWVPEKCVGQIRLTASTVDVGLKDISVEEAIAAGVKTLVIGVAPIGGAILPHWAEVLCKAAASGISVAAGLHTKLAEVGGLAEAAKQGGSRLIDVRNPPAGLPVGNGSPRSGKRVLAVGTDCAVGKKYTTLAIAGEMNARGMNADFRATGQTGIMIQGSGLPIDSVVADFISGAAETVSPANDADHWDVIEGQGSLFNPAYAGVSLGLLHGAQPDAIVLCHQPGRPHILGMEGYPIPSVQECIDLNLQMARLTNKNVKCVGVSVNTRGLSDSERQAAIAEIEQATGLPCADPLVEGVSAFVDALSKI